MVLTESLLLCLMLFSAIHVQDKQVTAQEVQLAPGILAKKFHCISICYIDDIKGLSHFNNMGLITASCIY